jgi:hypothetical protein
MDLVDFSVTARATSRRHFAMSALTAACFSGVSEALTVQPESVEKTQIKQLVREMH